MTTMAVHSERELFFARGTENGGPSEVAALLAFSRNHNSTSTFTLAMDIITLIGIFAALCTSASYFPQLKKCWETGKAEDLSFLTFSALAIGVAAWILYGFLRNDIVIIVANAVSFCCLAGILWFKIRKKPQRANSKRPVGIVAIAQPGDRNRSDSSGISEPL